MAVSRIASSLTVLLALVGTAAVARAACSPTPLAALGQQSTLAGIAATSATDAWAVGSAQLGTQPFAEHWDGATWSAAPLPSQPGGSLTSVAATSATNAWAVGYAGAGPLIVHWNGRSWVAVEAPYGADALASVSARGPRDVWTVGSVRSIATRPAALHWDGERWANVPTARVAGDDAALLGVAVAGARDAWAVGSAGGTGLIERWDGTAWNAVPSPSLRNGSLQAVSANGAEAWAVGQQVVAGRYRPVVERWDGRAWGLVATPDSGASTRYCIAWPPTTAASGRSAYRRKTATCSPTRRCSCMKPRASGPSKIALPRAQISSR